jgi:hypothetical protein
MASRVGTSQNPAPDKVIDPIKWERRRKAEARQQARIDEANTDEFAGHVQDYAHIHGLDAQQVLDTERAARARGNAGNRGLREHIEAQRGAAKTEPSTPTPARAPSNATSLPRPPASVRGAAGSAGGFVLGLFLYGFILNGVRYGTAGLKAFAEAKFFNKVTTGPWSSSATAPTSPNTAPGTVGEAPGQLPFYLVTPSPQPSSGTGS